MKLILFKIKKVLQFKALSSTSNSLLVPCLIVLLLFMGGLVNAQQVIYVATNGDNNNAGTCDKPVKTLQGAVNKTRENGAKTIWIRGGRYFFDQTVNLGSQDNGLTISGYKNEKVILDGGENVAANSFSKVTNNLSGRIKNSAVNKIYVANISDAALSTLLNAPDIKLSFNDKAINVARFPNEGFGIFTDDKTLDIQTVEEEGTFNSPKGWAFKMENNWSVNNNAWDEEIKRNKKARIQGYMSAVWLSETNTLVSAKHNGSYLRTMNGSRYGIKRGGKTYNKRVYFSNILYELDAPGEWYFDDIDNKLYVYPTTSTLNSSSRVTVWAGPECINIESGQNITIEKLTIQNTGRRSVPNGDGVIDIRGNSKNIKLAGVIFKNSILEAVNIWHDVRNSGIQSCDFIDVGSCRLYGGGISNNLVTKGNNYMINCHYTKVYEKDAYGKFVGINGAGQTFKNNLCHNTNGQPMTFAGVDHVIEENEFFNTGVEEGDGGSMYIGNSMWTYGTVMKHNFYHHMLSYPGLVVARAGIHLDDRSGGTTALENIFFRCGDGIRAGNGGGHILDKNVFIQNNAGIRNYYRASNSQEVEDEYNLYVQFIENDPLNRGKGNYIGRTLQNVGKSGWQNDVTKDNWFSQLDPWWTNRYPRFETVMQQYFQNEKILPYGCQMKDNFFSDNLAHNIFTNDDIVTLGNNDNVNLNIFTNPAILNFSFESNAPNDKPDIPFNSIGLYNDQYRAAIPNKNNYRKKVKDFFVDVKVHGAPLDYSKLVSDVYFNSGLVAFEGAASVTLNNSAPNVTSCDDNGNNNGSCTAGSSYKTLPGAALDIGTGGGETFVIGTNNNTWQWNECENTWDRFASTPAAKRIDVQGNGTPWIIGTDNRIYQWNGSSFKEFPGRATDIGINGNHIMVIGNGGKIYKWSNSNWRILPYEHSGMTRIDVSSNGRARAIGTDKKLYFDQGNGLFSKGDFSSHDVAVTEGRGEVYVVSTTDSKIYKYIGGGDYAVRGASKGRSLTVSNEQIFWLVQSNKKIISNKDCPDCGNNNNDNSGKIIVNGVYYIESEDNQQRALSTPNKADVRMTLGIRSLGQQTAYHSKCQNRQIHANRWRQSMQ